MREVPEEIKPMNSLGRFFAGIESVLSDRANAAVRVSCYPWFFHALICTLGLVLEASCTGLTLATGTFPICTSIARLLAFA